MQSQSTTAEKEYARQYWLKNRERLYQRHREWVAANLEKAREQKRASAKRWREKHPDRRRAQDRIATHRRRTVEGSFTPADWDALCARYGDCCLACKRTDRPLTIDHVVPISQGGTNWITDVQPLCKPCNNKKGARTIDYRP